MPAPEAPQALDELRAQQACARLIAQYAYLNDERRFEELAALFTEDAVLYRPSAPERAIEGRAAILEAFRKRPADTVTFHVCSDVIIDVLDGRTARGRSRILLLSTTRPAQGAPAPDAAGTPAPGVFRDSFRLTGQGWRFSERRGAFWI